MVGTITPVCWLLEKGGRMRLSQPAGMARGPAARQHLLLLSAQPGMLSPPTSRVPMHQAEPHLSVTFSTNVCGPGGLYDSLSCRSSWVDFFTQVVPLGLPFTFLTGSRLLEDTGSVFDLCSSSPTQRTRHILFYVCWLNE